MRMFAILTAVASALISVSAQSADDPLMKQAQATFEPIPLDKGRFAVSKTVSDEYVFRVPPPRNIELTPPYFHTGRSWDLRQAVGIMGSSQLGQKLTGDEISKITAYLKSLMGEQPQVTYPILPPSAATTPRPQP